MREARRTEIEAERNMKEKVPYFVLVPSQIWNTRDNLSTRKDLN